MRRRRFGCGAHRHHPRLCSSRSGLCLCRGTDPLVQIPRHELQSLCFLIFTVALRNVNGAIKQTFRALARKNRRGIDHAQIE